MIKFTRDDLQFGYVVKLMQHSKDRRTVKKNYFRAIRIIGKELTKKGMLVKP